MEKIVRVDLKSYFGDKQSDKLLFLVDSLDSWKFFILMSLKLMFRFAFGES